MMLLPLTCFLPSKLVVSLGSGMTQYCIIDGSTTPPDHHVLEIWGPAFVALAGVLVTLYAKWRSDAKERRLTLKRELYLRVADSPACWN